LERHTDDLADRTLQLLTRELAEQTDLVVTMGRGDECPYIPGKRYLEWATPRATHSPRSTPRTTRSRDECRPSLMNSMRSRADALR
jgi:hypothetical protein